MLQLATYFTTLLMNYRYTNRCGAKASVGKITRVAKRLRVLLVFDIADCRRPATRLHRGVRDTDNCYTKTTCTAALLENGYEVRLLGLYADVRRCWTKSASSKPAVHLQPAGNLTR